MTALEGNGGKLLSPTWNSTLADYSPRPVGPRWIIGKGCILPRGQQFSTIPRIKEPSIICFKHHESQGNGRKTKHMDWFPNMDIVENNPCHVTFFFNQSDDLNLWTGCIIHYGLWGKAPSCDPLTGLWSNRIECSILIPGNVDVCLLLAWGAVWKKKMNQSPWSS